MILDHFLYKFNIYINSAILNEELSPQVIVLTSTLSGSSNFVVSWYLVWTIVVILLLIILALFIRGMSQQIGN